jgi:hypothetical protein
MAWSVFTQGGGDGAALTWAQQLLTALGAPVTPGNEQFIYDWEQSEGGGGQYNPLNQGPVPGQPQLTSTGSQYGGGAADYVSYAAGIQGAVDYLNMSNYTAVKQALDNNDPNGAKSALIASPWAASHYGEGASFSNAPLPGQASSLLDTNGGVEAASTGTAESTNWLSDLLSGKPQGFSELFGNLFSGSSATSNVSADIKQWLVRGSLIVFGAIIIIIGLIKMTGSSKSVGDVIMAPVSGTKTVAKTAKKVTGS